MSLPDVIGRIPYRLALAGAWIDQPFISRLYPNPPGAMVVVGLEPRFHFMERSGLATSTRKAADRLWSGALPDRDPGRLVRELMKPLMGLWAAYQTRYPGAMFSGCGGGYLIVASEKPVPGSFGIKVRTPE